MIAQVLEYVEGLDPTVYFIGAFTLLLVFGLLREFRNRDRK